MKRLTVDWLRCDGHGLCAELLPEVVTVDEWGFPLIDGDIDDDLARQARRAVAACPALALILGDV